MYVELLKKIMCGCFIAQLVNMIFVVFVKAYDPDQHDLLWAWLEDIGVGLNMLAAIRFLYESGTLSWSRRNAPCFLLFQHSRAERQMHLADRNCPEQTQQLWTFERTTDCQLAQGPAATKVLGKSLEHCPSQSLEAARVICTCDSSSMFMVLPSNAPSCIIEPILLCNAAAMRWLMSSQGTHPLSSVSIV